MSQTPVEQQHIADAFTFELSKVERLDIRERTVANLRNVDDDLAGKIADQLGLVTLPDRSEPAAPPITDLSPSPALSIVLNGPDSFAGRKLGVLVSDGADAAVIEQLQSEVEADDGIIEFIAPKVGGFTTSDGTTIEADQQVGGGPSVLYDAVAVVVSDAGAAALADHPAARDFVADAYAHSKFIGHVAAAAPLLDAAGVSTRIDDGFVALDEDGAGAVPRALPRRQVLGTRAARADAPLSRDPRLVLMGVAGAGKTTVGHVVASRLHVPFLDADDYHDPAAIALMRAGKPLDDASPRTVAAARASRRPSAWTGAGSCSRARRSGVRTGSSCDRRSPPRSSCTSPSTRTRCGAGCGHGRDTSRPPICCRRNSSRWSSMTTS